MAQIIQIITQINDTLHGFIWGPCMLVFFLFVGLMFTIRTKLFQLVHIKDWMDITILSVFKKDNKSRRTDDKHSISQFQSLCTALA